MNLLTFWIENELYGIELIHVKEINRNIEYTSVPRANENIIGLFNMRGQVVTLFDLSHILNYERQHSQTNSTCIILDYNSSSELRGFLIDKSGDVIMVTDDQCEPTPANINSNESKYIKSIVKLENKLIRVIDLTKLLLDI